MNAEEKSIAIIDLRVAEIDRRLKCLRWLMWLMTSVVLVGFMTNCYAVIVMSNRGESMFWFFLAAHGALAFLVVGMIRDNIKGSRS